MLLRELVGLDKTAGDVGIEIEAEFLKDGFPELASRKWRAIKEPSLRNGIEYITTRPLKNDGELENSLKYILDKVNKHNVNHNCLRASVHVHINYRDETISTVLSSATVYWLLEDVLINMCGEHRKGNLFCMRLSDGERAQHVLKKLIDRNFAYDHNDTLRNMYKYSGQNLAPTCKLGSIEYRSMRGCYDYDHLASWISILLQIREAARRFSSPADVLDVFFRWGARAFIERVFDEPTARLVMSLHPNYSDVMHNSALIMFGPVYSFDWNEQILSLKKGEDQGTTYRAINVAVEREDGPPLIWDVPDFEIGE